MGFLTGIVVFYLIFKSNKSINLNIQYRDFLIKLIVREQKEKS
jgi:hypothetical protein